MGSTTKFSMALAIATAVVLSADARPGRGDRADHRRDPIGRLDANGDGALSLDEFGGGRLFDRLDRDGDGRIAPDEIPERAGDELDAAGADADRDGSITRAEADAARRQHFERLDADGDGLLTREELKAGRAARAVGRMDANGDGSVTFDEFGDGRRLDHLDADDDGVLTRDEAFRGSRQGTRFEKADADGDGRITPAETEARRREAFDRLDADDDGRLVPGELASRTGRGRNEGGASRTR